MWVWVWLTIIIFVVAAVLVARWMDRYRGSQGASRDSDLPGTKHGRPGAAETGDGFNGL